LDSGLGEVLRVCELLHAYPCSSCLPIGTLHGFIGHDSGMREHCAFDEQADAVTNQLDFERT